MGDVEVIEKLPEQVLYNMLADISQWKFQFKIVAVIGLRQRRDT